MRTNLVSRSSKPQMKHQPTAAGVGVSLGKKTIVSLTFAMYTNCTNW